MNTSVDLILEDWTAPHCDDAFGDAGDVILRLSLDDARGGHLDLDVTAPPSVLWKLHKQIGAVLP